MEEVEAEERDSKRQQQPLQRIQHAIDDLKQISLGEGTDDVDAIAKALGRLTAEVDRLSKLLDKIRSND